MAKLNYDQLRSNVAEAREELQRIEKELQVPSRPSEDDLQVWFDHAFFHLNLAWNARRSTRNQSVNLTDEDFNRWSKFPRDININKLPIPRRKAAQPRPKPNQRRRAVKPRAT